MTTNTATALTAPAPRPALAQLAALVREVSEMPEHRALATYAGYIATLACLHDEFAKFPRGTVENRQAYAAATKLFKAAREFASTHNLPHPNQALRDLGYTP
jgi:hypothetical protein